MMATTARGAGGEVAAAAAASSSSSSAAAAAGDIWDELKGICSLPPLSPLSPHPHMAFPQLFVS